MSDDDAQVSWMTLEPGTKVVTREGEELGSIGEVVADHQKDIFSGVTVRSGLLSKDTFVPADKIDQMTEGSVRLTISKAEADALEDYEA